MVDKFRNDRSAGDDNAGPDTPAPADLHWGPDRRLTPLAAAAMVAAALWGVRDTNPEDRLVAAVLVVAFGLTALLLIRIRVRLAAGAEGIVVTGPLHSRRIAWTDIDTIATPRRGRFGRHAAWLELEISPDHRTAADAPTESMGRPGAMARSGAVDSDDVPELLAFGAFDLGTDPARVGRALVRLRAGS